MANEFKIKKGLIVAGADGGTAVDVQGSQGQLFSVTDDLSGSIFTVSDISGVPILDVNSSGLVTVDGPFAQTGGGATILSGTLDVDGEVTIGSGEYLSWGTSGATAIEGSTVSDKMRFYTNSTLALTLDASQNATFAGTVEAATYYKSSGTSAVLGTATSGEVLLRPTAWNLSTAQSSFTTTLATIGTPATITGVLTVGNSGTSRFTDTSALPLQLNRGLAVDVVGTNGVALGLGSYTTGTTYVDAARIAANLEYNGTTASGDLFLQVNNSGTYSNALIINNDTNATFAGTISSGNISVTGGSGGNGQIDVLRTSGANVRIQSQSATGVLGVTTNHPLHLKTNDTTRVTIAAGGNVGIGTTSPGVKLHVVSANEQLTNFSSSAVDQLAYSQINANSSTAGVITGAAALELVGKANGSGHGRHAWIGAEGTNDTTLLTKLKFKVRGQTASGYNWAGAAEAPTIMTLEGDGNVGIGTTAPSSRLTVQAAGSQTTQRAITIFHDNTLAEGYASIGAQYTATNGYIDSEIRFGSETLNGACSFMSFATGCNNTITQGSNSERMRITSSGNVGIGTDSPVNKLNVNGDIGYIGVIGQGSIYGNTGNNSYANMQLYNPSTGYSTFNNQSYGYYFLTGGGTKMTILNNGNVGIGATNPRDILEIEGNMRFVNGEDHLLIKPNNDIQGADFIVGDGVDPTYTPIMSLDGQYGGKVTVETSVGSSTNADKTTLDIQGSQGQLFSVTDDLSGDIFSVADISGVPIMNVNSDGTSYFDGNVGINNSSPTAKLEITGDGTIDETAQIIINSGGVDNNSIIRFTDDEAGQICAVGTLEGNILTHASCGDIQFKTNNGNITGNTDIRMFINQSGSVGIGTVSPNAKLNVNGGIKIEGTSSLSFGGSGSVPAWGINSSGNDLIIDDQATTSGDVLFNNNGSVGIGTTTPGDKLHVNGTVRSQAPVSSDWGLLSFNSSGTSSSGVWFNAGSAQLLLRRSDNSLQTKIVSSGNSYINGGSLGLGTTSPNSKLDVISGTNNGIRISATDTTSNWRDIDIRSYVSQAQANAFPDGSAIYTTNPTAQTETAFSKYGGLVLQGRDDGNSSFAIRLGNGNGYATRMFMGATGATTFSNTVTATNFILSSDERLKENVEKVCDNRVKADWKTFELKTEKGQKRYGVIAQELEKTNPEFVREDSEGFKSVAYIDLLIAKIAELEARLEKLEK